MPDTPQVAEARERHDIGLVPPSPNLRPHPCNGMTAQVHLGESAYSTIIDPSSDGGVGWMLRYGEATVVRYVAASAIASYDYLLSGGITMAEATRRLRILRKARAQLLLKLKGSDNG